MARKLLLDKVDIPGIRTYDVYRREGGYKSVEKAIKEMTPDQVAYMDSLPSWLTAFWAFGVWGGLVGSILLLMRNRRAVWAYAISCLGAIVGLGYQIAIAKMPASMKAGAMGLTPWAIILITIFLVWYAWTQEKKGVLR